MSASEKNIFYFLYGKRQTLPVYFTSSKLFNKSALVPRYYGTPLSREKCVKLMMEVKRKTHFKRYMSVVPGFMDTLKIVKEIVSRSDMWNGIDGWVLEVLVNNALMSSTNCSIWPSRLGGGPYSGVAMQPQKMSLEQSVRRVFEYVGSGALQIYGLLDPVELVDIERQVLRKLVGYDADDVVLFDPER